MSIEDPARLAALAPAQKLAIIQSHTRDALAERLWHAALGQAGQEQAASTGSGPGDGLSFESLIALLTRSLPAAPPTSENAPGAPVSTPEPARTSPLGPNRRFAEDLASAAERTGIPATAITAIIDGEAGKDSSGAWNVQARNPRSSAAGLGQFLSGTWLGLAETRGSWLNGVARANGWLSADGRLLPPARSDLLALRYDGTASINTIADYARLNLDGLKSRGVAVGTGARAIAGTAYLAHYLGLGDTMRYLRDQLGPERARRLLEGQIGSTATAARIARSGDAVTAHRDWLLAHIARSLPTDAPARLA